MARTLEAILKEQVGNLVFTCSALQHQVEELTEQIQTLTLAKVEDAKDPSSPN